MVMLDSDAAAASDLVQERADLHLREMAANLLRIMAGAGKPDALIAQIADAALALYACDEHGLRLVDSIIGRLRFENPDYEWHLRKYGKYCADAWRSNGQIEAAHAEEEIVRYSLRTAASRLIGQHTQEQTAKNAMLKACRRRVECRYGV